MLTKQIENKLFYLVDIENILLGCFYRNKIHKEIVRTIYTVLTVLKPSLFLIKCRPFPSKAGKTCKTNVIIYPSYCKILYYNCQITSYFRVRHTTYEKVLLLQDRVLSGVLRTVMVNDVINPVLSPEHYDALDRRIKHVLIQIQICFNKFGKETVLIRGDNIDET